MNRIAFVSSDEMVRVASPDALDAPHQAVSPQGHRCVWPAWSPNGEDLMYSVYPAAGSNGHGAFRIISRPAGKPATAIYTNEPGTDAIAQQTPHYLMWSPDGSKVAFIAQTVSSGMSLMVADAAGEAAPVRLLDGAPLFFCWSQDSEYIFAHVRELHYLIRLSDPEPAQVPVASIGYQTPSVNPHDGRIAMCGEMSDTLQGIVVATVQGGAEVLGEVEGSVGFSWRPGSQGPQGARPQGAHLGIVSGLNRGSGYYDRLTLLDVSTTAERVLIEEPILCFFWSPDGSKIAYVTPSEGAQGSVRWGMLDLETDEVRYLADFIPSREQLTMFMFFDQYGQSHGLWSPDSDKILFSGILGRVEGRGPLPDGRTSSVYIADGMGGDEPELVGQGSMAVWSV